MQPNRGGATFALHHPKGVLMEPQFIDVEGKVIAQCIKFQDERGYDTLSIRFTDGSRLMVKEEGQAGCFSVVVATPAPPTAKISGDLSET